MRMQEIQDIYNRCGIAFGTEQQQIRTAMNTGSLNNRLNTNYAGLNKQQEQTVFVNSAKE